jgi:hypothetical protein
MSPVQSRAYAGIAGVPGDGCSDRRKVNLQIIDVYG